MTVYRIGDAAAILGASPDTVRRWADAGRLAAQRDASGCRLIDSADLAAFARTLGHQPEGGQTTSARNRLRGIVTAVTSDTVMAQVEMQAGPFRIVSLMSRESVDELDLRVGSLVVAVVKSTNVVVERG